MDLRAEARDLHEKLASTVQTQRRCMREIAIGLSTMRRKKYYKELGYASLVEYGEQALGFRDGKTGQLATLGDRLRGLPRLDAAMVKGAVGWTTARTIARVATPDTEDAWLKRAMEISGRELEDQASEVDPGALPPEADDDTDPYRHVWMSLRLDVLDADLLMRAMAVLRQRYGDISGSQMMMAEKVVCDDIEGGEEAVEEPAGPARPTESPALHRIIEHRCPECDKAWVDTEAGEYELSRDERERIECDAEVVQGDPESEKAGHVTRTIPPSTREKVLIRDHGKCQVPGCRSRSHLELHHIQYRSDGGTHDPDNLVTLCWAHHSMVHKDVIQLSRAESGELEVARDSQDGPALGVLMNIWMDRAEIDHAYLDEFEDGPRGWDCIQGYWGKEVALEARERKDERTFVPPPPEDERAFVRRRVPELRYPRGKMVFRYGDDQRPAPFWMERPMRC